MAAGTVGHPLQRLGAHGAGIVHLPAIEGGGGGGAGAPRVFRASAKSEEAGRPGGECRAESNRRAGSGGDGEIADDEAILRFGLKP